MAPFIKTGGRKNDPPLPKAVRKGFLFGNGLRSGIDQQLVMLVDRQFIEDHAEKCCRGETWACILVQQTGRKDGILVMPEEGCYVGWAAYVV